MRRRPAHAISVGLVLLSLLSAACAPDGSRAPAATPSGPTVLRYAMPSFGEQTLDPTRSATAALSIAGPMWDWLTYVDPGGKLQPGLALSWTEGSDNRSWTFKLRQGVKFHDGTELTAEDVKFTYMDAFRRPQSITTRSAQFRQVIKDVEVVDRYTARVVTASRAVTFPFDISNQPGIEGIVLPKEYITKVGWDEYAKRPVGTGPWKFVRYEAGSIVEYEAFADHWRARPKFDRLQMLLVPEESTRLAMLRTGEADVATITLDGLPDAERAGLKVVADPERTSVRIQLMGTYYPTAGPIGDVRVREALNLAVNREEMVKTLFRGRAEPAAVDPIGKVSIGFPADLRPRPYDPVRARRLLSEAGLPNGFTIRLYSFSTAGFAQHQQLAEAVAGFWDAIGVKTTITPVDLAVIRPKYQANPQPADVVGTAFTFANGPRLNGLDDIANFYTIAAGGSKLAQMDDYVKRGQTASTVEEISKIVQDAYRVIYDDFRTVPIANVDGLLWAYGTRVSSVQVRPHRGFIEPSLDTVVPAR